MLRAPSVPRSTSAHVAAALMVVAVWPHSFSRSADTPEPFRFAADRPLDCLHIKLELEVDLEREHVDATASLDLVALRDLSTITLDALDLETSSVAACRGGGELAPVKWRHDGERLEIRLEPALKTGDRLTVAVEYAVDRPSAGLHFFGPTENEPDVDRVVWSQGESIFNRHWFPCFDHPNERQTTELVATVKQGYEVSSNGRLISRAEDPETGTVTFHWLQDKPHVAYLVSLIAGEFHITRDTWRGKPVEYWVHPRFRDDVGRSFRNTKRMLDFFSDSIGVEYPWDRYAQICCEGFGGGMENTAATTLGNRALHDARSFIDSNSDGLIAHELAHQWFGDLLTCRDWAHLWLNEGFASYFEALWAEEDLGADEFEYNMFRKGDSARRGGKTRPIVDRAYDHSRSMFDSRAYPKGAWVLHMIRRRLGDELFWKVINRWVEDHAFRTVETVDLRKTVEQVTGRAFERFFYDWTERPGHPEVTVSFTWLPEERAARVDVKQTQEASAFHFPLAIEFRLDGDRPPVKIERVVTEKETTIYQRLPEAPALVRVDPLQTVLMELTEKKGRDLWRAQLVDDPSPVARIRAARHLGESNSDADRTLLADALSKESFWGVQSEIARSLGSSGGDIARDALLAGLKLENHKARRACVGALASFKGDDAVIEAVRPIVVDGDPSYFVEREAIETYAALGAPDAFEVLKGALSRDSRFEVIRSAALAGLGRLETPELVPLLCEWTRPDKPRRCRPSAIGALSRLTRRMLLDAAAIDEIVASIVASLDDTGERVRSAAVRALGALGEPARARSALSALERIASGDPSKRIRDAAEETIKAIEAGKPAPVQVAELREQLKAALEQNEELEGRVEKLEALLEGSQK